MKRIFIIIGIITAIIVLPNVPYYYRSYVISQEKLPQEFENYEKKNDKNFNIKHVDSDLGNGNSILSNDSILFAENSYKGEYCWYKINLNGKIDSLIKLGEKQI